MIFLGHHFCQGYSLWQVNGTPKSHVTSNIFLNAKILVQNFKKRWFLKFFQAFLGLNSPLMIYLCPSFDQCYSPWRARGPPKRYFSSSTFFKQNFMFKILKNAIFGKLSWWKIVGCFWVKNPPDWIPYTLIYIIPLALNMGKIGEGTNKFYLL